MKLSLTESEIKLDKDANGYKYQIKDIKVSNIPTKEEAIAHAENLAMKFIRKMFN